MESYYKKQDSSYFWHVGFTDTGNLLIKEGEFNIDGSTRTAYVSLQTGLTPNDMTGWTEIEQEEYEDYCKRIGSVPPSKPPQ